MISTVFAFYRNLPCLTKPPMSTLGWSQPLWVGLVLLSSLVFEIQGHGRLMEPVSRASAWRRGYPNPADYNDNQGYCGGYSVRILTVFFGEFCCFSKFLNFWKIMSAKISFALACQFSISMCEKNANFNFTHFLLKLPCFVVNKQ